MPVVAAKPVHPLRILQAVFQPGREAPPLLGCKARPSAEDTASLALIPMREKRRVAAKPVHPLRILQAAVLVWLFAALQTAAKPVHPLRILQVRTRMFVIVDHERLQSPSIR